MPEPALRLPGPGRARSRVLAAGLALAFLTSVSAIEATPASAANWTRQIAATRASQLYYEGLMRSADRQIKSIKRSTKRTQRKLRKGKRNIGRTKARRARLTNRFNETRQRYRAARRALDAAMAPSDELLHDPAGAILVLSTLEPPALEQDHQDGANTLGTVSIADGGTSSDPAGLDADVEIEDLAASTRGLKKQLRKHRRTARKAAKKHRRVARNVRVRARTLASLKRQRRAAIARREGAEGALASQILAMSNLAQRRAAKKTKVRPSASSGFTWPVRGRLSQTYGCTGFGTNPSRGSCRHFHDGIDIPGYRGSPIRAAAVGVVSYVGWNPWDAEGRAFIVVVAHPGGYETLYAHVLPTRRVRVGQLVRRGEVIASMGSTGNSTGNHLHFELRRGRTTLNPLGFL